MIRRAIVPFPMLAVAGLGLALVPGRRRPGRRKRPVLRDVLYVGDNWDGTADVVQPHRFRRLAHIDIVPDIAERMREIESNPERLGYFLAIGRRSGEGPARSSTTCSRRGRQGPVRVASRASRT